MRSNRFIRLGMNVTTALYIPSHSVLQYHDCRNSKMFIGGLNWETTDGKRLPYSCRLVVQQRLIVSCYYLFCLSVAVARFNSTLCRGTSSLLFPVR